MLVLVALLTGGLGMLAVERVLRSPGRVRDGSLRTVARVVVAAGGVVLGALALLQRQNDALVRVDHDVAGWAHEHATHLSTRVITLVTDLGSSPSCRSWACCSCSPSGADCRTGCSRRS